MKIVYLHGLDSNNVSPKNDWLKTFSELFDPQIDYRENNIYQNLKSEVAKFKPNLIIGSSMGGYFGYEFAKEFNINAILFNPALHSRSYQPDMTGLDNGKFKPSIQFVFGKNDTVINAKITMEILIKEGFTNENFTLLNYGHDTSLEIFKNEILSVYNICYLSEDGTPLIIS